MEGLDIAPLKLKIERAIEHLDRLRAEAKTRARKHPYGFRIEEKHRAGKQVDVTVFAKFRSSPPPEWGPIIGDIVQNLRNVLDYAVWQLARPSKRSLRTQFPIFSDRCEYQVLSPPMLAGVPKPYCALIKEEQPYQWEDGPEFHPLALLRILSNTDKHRTLIPMAVIQEIGFVAVTNADTEFTFTAEGRPIEDGAPVLRFTARPQDPRLEMKVQPEVTFDEAIEGSAMLPTLEALLRHVEWVIARLASTKKG